MEGTVSFVILTMWLPLNTEFYGRYSIENASNTTVYDTVSARVINHSGADLLYDADGDGQFVNVPMKRQLSRFLQRANEPVPLFLPTDPIDWPGLVTVVKELVGNNNAPGPADQVSINHNAAWPSTFETDHFQRACQSLSSPFTVSHKFLSCQLAILFALPEGFLWA